jgi:hypothetical protein
VKHTAPPQLGIALSRNLSHLVAGAALLAALSCAKVNSDNSGGGGGGGGSGSGNSSGTGNGGNGGVTPPPMLCQGKCNDFPSDPQVDTSCSSNPSGMFGSSSGPAPCVTEPEDGTLFPVNWLRARVKVSGSNGPIKVTVHDDNESNDLVGYSCSDNWKIPKDIWTAMGSHLRGDMITMTVQTAGSAPTTVKFSIAPVSAAGNLVFWAANPALVGKSPQDCQKDITMCANASALRGFAIGDESTVEVLRIDQVKQPSRDDGGNNQGIFTCIGCHAGTPDSGFVSIVDHYDWRAGIASVASGTSGAAYSTLSPGGFGALMQPGWGPMTFTKSNGRMDFWKTGLKIGIASLGMPDPTVPQHDNYPDQNDRPHLAWVNLEAPNEHVKANSDQSNWVYTSFAPNTGIDSGNGLGFLKHDGDAGGATFPNWSHDGNNIVYASTNASISGRLNIEVPSPDPSASDPRFKATAQTYKPGPPTPDPGIYPDNNRKPGLTDLYIVPFNNGDGGTASPVKGAATTQFEEYYPAFSPDDKLIAYTRVPGGEVMFANADAEIAVVQSNGTATRLSANDPPKCTGKASPGINNHWPKWSPEVANSMGRTYYWLIFSSNRAGLQPVTDVTGASHQISQLYMVPVVIDETGNVGSYPAIYLWNQPIDRVNTTPAWETFMIPTVQ